MKDSSERLGVKSVGGLKEVSTPWAGAGLLVDLFRNLELDRTANGVLPAKKSLKGLEPGQTVKSLVLLSALGGEHVEDMEHVRTDGRFRKRPWQRRKHSMVLQSYRTHISNNFFET